MRKLALRAGFLLLVAIALSGCNQSSDPGGSTTSLAAPTAVNFTSGPKSGSVSVPPGSNIELNVQKITWPTSGGSSGSSGQSGTDSSVASPEKVALSVVPEPRGSSILLAAGVFIVALALRRRALSRS